MLIWGEWSFRKYIRPYFTKRKLAQWLAQQPSQRKWQGDITTLKQLYRLSPTHMVAWFAKKKYKLTDLQFLYGEVHFLSFLQIVSLVSPKEGEHFVDMGSGAGKAVLTASLCFPFASATGIEILPGLVNLAQKKAQTLQSSVAINTDISFYLDDFLNYPLEDTQVVFINATAFQPFFWQQIQARLHDLPKGARVIVNTRTIQSDAFQLIHRDYHVMSWGLSTVAIYEKVSGNDSRCSKELS